MSTQSQEERTRTCWAPLAGTFAADMLTLPGDLRDQYMAHAGKRFLSFCVNECHIREADAVAELGLIMRLTYARLTELDIRSAGQQGTA